MQTTDIAQYFAKLWIAGRTDPIVYRLEERDSQRLRNCLLDSTTEFYCADTLNGPSVAVRLDDVDAVNILWELGAPETVAEPDDDSGVRILFRDRAPPFESSVANPVDIADLLFDLDIGRATEERFLAFVDEDGEEMLINVRRLSLIEVPEELANEGRRLVAERDGAEPDIVGPS